MPPAEQCELCELEHPHQDPAQADHAVDRRPWRVAESLEVLLAEINAAAPNRSIVSDGSIGDPNHASQGSASDHNPWVIKDGVGIVRARDFTHDPAGGLDCHRLADSLADLIRDGAHPALDSGAYIIWDRRILSRDRIGEGWRTYTGSNPHTTHLHLSVTTDLDEFDSPLPWGVMEEQMTQEQMEQLADLAAERVWDRLIKPVGQDDRIRAAEMLAQTHNRAGKTRRLLRTLLERTPR